MRKLLRLFSGLLCASSVCGSVEADLASFSANPDRLPEMQTQHIPVLEWRRPTKFGDPIARAAPGFTAARVAVSERGAEKVKTSAPLVPFPRLPKRGRSIPQTGSVLFCRPGAEQQGSKP